MTAGPNFDEIAEAIAPDQLARALGAERVGSGWRCPSADHDDEHPSFSLFKDGRRTAGKCHGCGLAGSPVTLAARVWGVSTPEAAERLVSELGLHVASGNGDGPGARWDQEDADRALHRRGLRPETIERFRITADLAKQAWRFPVRGGGARYKRFGPGKPKAWWAGSKPGLDADLYGLGGVPAESAWLLLVEGEPDVWTGQQAGLPAVTFTGGATTVPGSGVRALAEDGRPVTILYDADDAGREGARKAARALRDAGVEVELRRHVDLAPGGDLTDLYGSLGLDDEALREEVAALPVVDDAAEEAARPFVIQTLAEILDDPESLGPPPVVAPRLAWGGRVTLLAAREKMGKSTLATAAAAAVSTGGHFLGDLAPPGVVLWTCIEEHPRDLGTRFVTFHAAPDRVHIIKSLDLDRPVEALAEAVERVGPSLVVVDTLPALVQRVVETPSQSAEWTPILAGLTRIARDSDAAVLLLHHSKKSDGRYRDSTAVGAGVDAIVEMRRGKQDSLRRLDPTGSRWRMEVFEARLAGDVYQLVGAEPGPKVQVLTHLVANPGASMRALREAVTGRAKDVDEAVRDLLAAGRIEDRGDASGRALYPCRRPCPGPSDDRGENPGGCVPRNAPGTRDGHGSDTGVGHGSHPPVSRPPSPRGGGGHGARPSIDPDDLPDAPPF